MARNPVTPVTPVDAVVSVRRVDSGSTYYRHLDQWRFHSELYAAERRDKEQRMKAEQPGKTVFKLQDEET